MGPRLRLPTLPRIEFDVGVLNPSTYAPDVITCYSVLICSCVREADFVPSSPARLAPLEEARAVVSYLGFKLASKLQDGVGFVKPNCTNHLLAISLIRE